MKLSQVQREFLTLLSDGKAHRSGEVPGRKYVTVNTLNKLRDHDCILSTPDGFRLTDIGRTALETGILP